MTREEQIIKYRPMVYWIVQKLNAPQDLYVDLIEEGMSSLISGVDEGIQELALYNRVRNKVIAKMIELTPPSIAKETSPVEVDKDWTIDLEHILEHTDMTPPKERVHRAGILSRLRGIRGQLRIGEKLCR